MLRNVIGKNATLGRQAVEYMKRSQIGQAKDFAQ